MLMFQDLLRRFAAPSRHREHRAFLPLAGLLAIFGSDLAAQACETVRPYGPPPHTAEDYPIPLSARINLRRLMKREMHAIGRYNDAATVDDGVFHTLLRLEIMRLQRERGEDPTGCITWELVTLLDSKGRTPPPEAIAAFK